MLADEVVVRMIYWLPLGVTVESRDNTAAILPLATSLLACSSVRFDISLIEGFFNKPFFIRTLFVSDSFFIATRIVTPPRPINANTKMKINGKTKLKITAEGLLKIALKLPRLIANIARTWL